MEERTAEEQRLAPGCAAPQDGTWQEPERQDPGVQDTDQASAGLLGEDREEAAQNEAEARQTQPPLEEAPFEGLPLGQTSEGPLLEEPPAPPASSEDQPLLQLARELLMQQAQRQLEQQMEQIHRLDPELGDLTALARQPEFPEFDRLVKSGQDLVSAYKLAFFERYARNSAQAARQAAINAARSKEHLAAVGQGSQPQDDGLTDELVQRYRIFNPGMSRSQIARYHARYRKEKQDVSYL